MHWSCHRSTTRCSIVASSRGEAGSMSPINPYLQELGFHADDRVVVVHADDIGMCHATLPAIDELMAFGLVTSASAMVPCPWFLEAASWHRRYPQFDLG